MATVRIQLRRGTASQWTSANPILAAGEMGVETDTRKVKIGDGTTSWSSLDYVAADSPEISEIAQDAINDALVAGTGITKSYDDNANTITVSVDTSVIATKAELAEVAQDSINDALTAGTGITKSYDDAANTLTVSVDTTTIATQAYADQAEADAITTAAADATSKANAAQAAAEATAAADATTKANAAQAAAEATAAADATTKANAAQAAAEATAAADATTKANAAQAAAEATAAADATTKANAAQAAAEATAAADATTKANAAESNANNYTDGQITDLIGTAPSLLNTLGELADALADDENFASTVTSSLSSLDNLKAPKANPVFTGTVTLPADTLIGDVSANEIGYLNGVTSGIQTQLDAKAASADVSSTYAPKASPVFTGTVTLPADTLIGDVSATEIGYLDGVTSGIQTQLDAKAASADVSSTYAPKASPVFTGTVTLPADTLIGDVSATEIGHLNGVTSGLQTQLDAKAPTASPTFTGTVTLPADTLIGDVSATEIGYLNGVTSGIQTQLDNKQTQIDTKAPTAGPTFTGTVTLPSSTSIGDVSATEIGYLSGVTSAVQTQLDAKAASADVSSTYAPIASPVFTGTVGLPSDTSIGDVSATEIGHLNGVTSGLQTQLDAKAPIANPTFTGTVTLPDGTVNSAMIATETIVDADISTTAAINKSKISGVAITAADNGTVTSTMIANGTIVNDDISASASIAQSKIANLTTDLAAKALGTDLDSHTGATTSVHGIADTSALATSTDVSTAQTAAQGYADSAVTTHNSDTTSVHGISDTSQLAYLNAASQTFTGSVEIDQNLTVDGNLTVNGTTFNASSTSIVIEDNMVQLAHQNAANTVDLGLVVAYNDGTAKHSGIVRDVSADKWKLFKGVTSEPATTVDFTQGSLDDLEVKNLDAAEITATGAITASASGVVFTDGTQTKEAVPSRTVIYGATNSNAITASATLSDLAYRDSLIEVDSASSVTLTVPPNSTAAFPIGASWDIVRMGTGAVVIAEGSGVTINATPGLNLRAQYSSATLFKRGTDSWLLIGDLSA